MLLPGDSGGLVSLLFPAPSGCPPSSAHGPLPSCWKPATQDISDLTSVSHLWLSSSASLSTVKDSCDYMGRPWSISLYEGQVSSTLISIANLISHCQANQYSHRFQGLGFGPLQGTITLLTIDALILIPSGASYVWTAYDCLKQGAFSPTCCLPSSSLFPLPASLTWFQPDSVSSTAGGVQGGRHLGWARSLGGKLLFNSTLVTIMFKRLRNAILKCKWIWYQNLVWPRAVCAFAADKLYVHLPLLAGESKETEDRAWEEFGHDVPLFLVSH